MKIIGLRCWFCNGTGRVDWRDATSPNHQGAVTAEAHGVTLVDCPHCGGLGVVPGFASLADVEMQP